MTIDRVSVIIYRRSVIIDRLPMTIYRGPMKICIIVGERSIPFRSCDLRIVYEISRYLSFFFFWFPSQQIQFVKLYFGCKDSSHVLQKKCMSFISYPLWVQFRHIFIYKHLSKSLCHTNKIRSYLIC